MQSSFRSNSRNLNRVTDREGLPKPPVRSLFSSLIVPATMLLAIAIIGAFLSFRVVAARAADLSELINPGVAQDSNLADFTDPCLKNLPVPAPSPGLHRVIQMVNCSNQTILGSADAAGRAPNPPVGVLPREKTWVMGKFGSANRPDGSPGNVLTIDVPLVWENTGPIKSTGPIIWARTGCRYDIASGRAQCETGGCGGLYDCSANKLGPSAGATITEWTFFQEDPNRKGLFLDHPDISAVNGVNLNVDIEALGGDPFDPTGKGNPFWLAKAYPLTVHGEDLRSQCNPSNFQVNRSDLTTQKTGIIASVIVGNDNKPLGGNGIVACLSNCARYEYPFVPPGKVGKDGQIHAELCDPTNKASQCYRWKVFCTPLGGAYDQLCPGQAQMANAPLCNVTPPVPMAGGVVPIPPYKNGAFHGACWVRGIPSVPKPMPRCSGDSFIKEADCPANICTHPFKEDPSAQPPFGHCSDVDPTDPNACIGDDTIHQVMNKAYTWPNDPQTYVDNAPGYRIIFSPGGNPTTAPITPSTTPIPLCSSLPAIYDIGKWALPKGLCSVPIKQGAIFAVAHPPNCNPLGPNCNWACDLSNGSKNPPVLPGSGDDGVVCRWK
jgi:hypothetical protein